MEANELRIGNFIEKKEITYSGLKTLTHAIEIKDLAHYESFEPILITEEWLLKFGFVKENKRETEHHSNFYSMCVYDYKYSFAYADFRNDWGFYHSYTDALNDSDNNKFDFISCGIKYVHQLQNLYFALTGKELEINMTADEILKKHEDANEMHFHEVDRKWIIEAMEEYARVNL
jgi:hypothetical protein